MTIYELCISIPKRLIIIKFISFVPQKYSTGIGKNLESSISQCFPKKSYGFETHDSLGKDMHVSLLELPEESDFVLYAPYSDKSCIRNVLAYKLSESTGHYAPHTHYCELMINGDLCFN